MRFWDTSAVVPLLVRQAPTARLVAELERDPAMFVWWATEVECVSALARTERDRDIHADGVTEALARLAALAGTWREVQPTTRVRLTATRMLRVHPLRAADALQLAAAYAAAEDDPPSMTMVTLDERLARAAEREGFPVIVPTD